MTQHPQNNTVNNKAEKSRISGATNYGLAFAPAIAATMYYFVKNTRLEGYELYLVAIIVFVTLSLIVSYTSVRKVALQFELNTAPNVLLFGMYYFYVILHVLIIHKLFVVLTIPLGYYLLPVAIILACHWVMPFELRIIQKYPVTGERFGYFLIVAVILGLVTFFVKMI